MVLEHFQELSKETGGDDDEEEDDDEVEDGGKEREYDEEEQEEVVIIHHFSFHHGCNLYSLCNYTAYTVITSGQRYVFFIGQ
jgi:hypothetical protein